MTAQLQEPKRVDEPKDVGEYANVITRVASERRAVVLRREGADVAAIIPVDYLELLQDALAREQALALARKLDWDRLVKEYPPPQAWFDGDEPKPF
jgi:hypothetical protein